MNKKSVLVFLFAGLLGNSIVAEGMDFLNVSGQKTSLFGPTVGQQQQADGLVKIVTYIVIGIPYLLGKGIYKIYQLVRSSKAQKALKALVENETLQKLVAQRGNKLTTIDVLNEIKGNPDFAQAISQAMKDATGFDMSGEDLQKYVTDNFESFQKSLETTIKQQVDRATPQESGNEQDNSLRAGDESSELGSSLQQGSDKTTTAFNQANQAPSDTSISAALKRQAVRSSESINDGASETGDMSDREVAAETVA